MFKEWSIKDYVYYFGSLTILSGCSIVYHSTMLSLVVSICGLTGVMLNMKRQKLCFVFYIIQCLLYTYLAYQQQFYGEVLRNLLYSIPMYLISLVRWLKDREDSMQNAIYSLSARNLVQVIVVMCIGSLAYGYILSQVGSMQPYLNALSTFVASIGTFMAAKSIKDQWYFWTFYNFVLLALWLSTVEASGLSQLPLLVINVIYLVINIEGILKWEKLSKQQGIVIYRSTTTS